MEEHTLLIRHARSWAEAESRRLDEELLGQVLHLRDTHDDLAYGAWPGGSAERLLLVTWPAYGPPPPDVEELGQTLDTFWGFLRATGRMNARSASPAELRKEMRRCLPRMAEAYDDPVNHSQGRVLGDFGRSRGIEQEGAADIEELQGGLDAVQRARNELPQAERIRLMPDPSPTSVLGQAWTRTVNQARTGRPYPPWPEGDDEDEADEDVGIRRGDPAVSGRLGREAPFVQQCLALAEWVGGGREVTSAGLLRPPVARDAYRHLGLWPWEREHRRIRQSSYGVVMPDLSPEADAVMETTAIESWRSAGDCLALDRLWYACAAAELVAIGSRKAVRCDDAADTDEEWRDLSLTLLYALCLRLGSYTLEPLAGMMLLAHLADEPVPIDAARAWWDSRCPETLRAEDLGWQQRLDEVWFHLGGGNLWDVEDDHYTLTDVGRDFLIVYLGALDDGVFDD